MKYKHGAMGSIFSKIMAAPSEPAAPLFEVQGDITCCNCDSSDDESTEGNKVSAKKQVALAPRPPPRPKGLDAYR